MYTNKQFVEYIKKQLEKNTVYMFGDFMRVVTTSTINGKVKQYPSYYSTDRINYLKSLVGKDYYGSDCSGLIKSFFFTENGTKANVYNSKYDNTDNLGRNDIKTLPETPGTYLYMPGHVGVYIGNGEVIECTSNVTLSKKTYGGVCKTKLTDRKWETWAYSKYLEYEVEEMFKVGDVIYAKEDVTLYSNAGYGNASTYLLVKDSKATVKLLNNVNGNYMALADDNGNYFNPGAWTNEIDKFTTEEPKEDYEKLYNLEVEKNKELQEKINKAIEILN